MEGKLFEHYSLLSKVLRYPSATLENDAIYFFENIVEDRYPEAKEDFQHFANWVQNTPLHEMEEVYTRTFHIQAICYLDLGYVIFGEDYKRGEFLVNMKREQREAGNDCGDELPDNLVNVLRLMPKLEDTAFRNELAVRILIPALEKMIREFEEARLERKVKALKKKHKALILENQRNGNIYQYALRTLLTILQKDFEGVHYAEAPYTPEVLDLASCGSGCSFVQTKSIKSQKS